MYSPVLHQQLIQTRVDDVTRAGPQTILKRAIVRRILVALSTVAVASLVAAAAASASSIVYVKQGNIWLSSPDGAIQRQVTTDGGYSSPSQADDGNIVALHGGMFVHLDRHGHLLSPPVQGLAGASGGTTSFGPQDPRVSPDDSNIAYDVGVLSSRWDAACSCYEQTTQYQTLETAVDRFTDPSVDGIVRDYATPSWVDNHTALLTATGIGIDQFATYLPGGGGDTDPTHFTQWFSDLGSPRMAKAQLTRSGDKLVALAGNASENIGIYSIDNPLPAAPGLRCVINEPSPGTTYDDPTWSPEGGALAFADPNGVYLTPVGNVASGDCSSISPQLLLPGASQPFWGPADVALSDGIQTGGQPGPPGQPHTTPPTGSGHRPHPPAPSTKRCVRGVRHHKPFRHCTLRHRHPHRHGR